MEPPGPERLTALTDDKRWRSALRAAPRHLFVPDRGWTVGKGLIDRALEPDAWWDVVHTNDAIVTQVADGELEFTTENVAQNPHRYSSSCSAPSLVLHFLRLLDPYDGDRVLEIGTGTGWTAALLSARLDAGDITTIEVDEQVAKQAAANLGRAGFEPRLIVGDGAEGWPEGEPFDRIHVTCGVVDVPYAWVAQTRPGGIITLPWSPSFDSTNFRARLTVTGDVATGRFHGECGFMKLRSQRNPFTPIRGDVRKLSSTVDPRRISAADPGLWIALAGLMPGVAVGTGGVNPVDGTFRLAARDLATDSHVLSVQPPEGGEAEVSQTGPRPLWEELEAAYLAWVGWGEPDMGRLGLTVDRDGQHVWLDSPDNRIAEVRL